MSEVTTRFTRYGVTTIISRAVKRIFDQELAQIDSHFAIRMLSASEEDFWRDLERLLDQLSDETGVDLVPNWEQDAVFLRPWYLSATLSDLVDEVCDVLLDFGRLIEPNEYSALLPAEDEISLPDLGEDIDEWLYSEPPMVGFRQDRSVEYAL